MGAFNFDVERIHLDELEVKWIYEAEKEKGSVPITSHKRIPKQKKTDKILDYIKLFHLIEFEKTLSEEYIVFSYYRQAKNFFNNYDYYFAFINYFMMLEFMFAEGQFHQAGMISKFKNSKLLELCVLTALNMLEDKDENAVNYTWLLEECKKRNKNLDFEGVNYVLIQYRGLLSHASTRSKQFLLEVEHLRPIAFITSLICFLLCGYIQVYCCSSEESRNRMIINRIEELKKK